MPEEKLRAREYYRRYFGIVVVRDSAQTLNSLVFEFAEAYHIAKLEENEKEIINKHIITASIH